MHLGCSLRSSNAVKWTCTRFALHNKVIFALIEFYPLNKNHLRKKTSRIRTLSEMYIKNQGSVSAFTDESFKTVRHPLLILTPTRLWNSPASRRQQNNAQLIHNIVRHRNVGNQTQVIPLKHGAPNCRKRRKVYSESHITVHLHFLYANYSLLSESAPDDAVWPRFIYGCISAALEWCDAARSRCEVAK